MRVVFGNCEFPPTLPLAAKPPRPPPAPREGASTPPYQWINSEPRYPFIRCAHPQCLICISHQEWFTHRRESPARYSIFCSRKHEVEKIPRLKDYKEWAEYFAYETVRFIRTDEDGTFGMLPKQWTVFCYRSNLMGLPIERDLVAVAYRSYDKLVDLYPPDYVSHTLNFLYEMLLPTIPSGVYIKSINVNLIVVCNYTPLFVPGSVCYDYVSVCDNASFLGFSGTDARIAFIMEKLKEMDDHVELLMRCLRFDPTLVDDEWQEISISLIPPILLFQVGMQGDEPIV